VNLGCQVARELMKEELRAINDDVQERLKASNAADAPPVDIGEEESSISLSKSVGKSGRGSIIMGRSGALSPLRRGPSALGRTLSKLGARPSWSKGGAPAEAGSK
jgi:hypothetical protein